MRLLSFTAVGWDHYQWWVANDRRTLRKVNTLISEALRTPFDGTGKPEHLKYVEAFGVDADNVWSRRITDEHRFVYEVRDDSILVLALRFHYA
jgi:toxin YoeB